LKVQKINLKHKTMKKLDFAIQTSVIGITIVTALFYFVIGFISTMLALSSWFTFTPATAISFYSFLAYETFISIIKAVIFSLIIWQLISAIIRIVVHKEKTMLLWAYICVFFSFVCSMILYKVLGYNILSSAYIMIGFMMIIYYYVITIIYAFKKQAHKTFLDIAN